MINLPRILNSRYVREAVPQIINNRIPPIVSYKYTKTIAGRIKKELDIDRGTIVTVVQVNTVMTLQGMLLLET